MDTVLWAVQIVLAIKFASVAFTHGLRMDQTKMQQGIQRMGPAARPVLSVIALAVLVGAAGLVLPAATRVSAGLTPLAAGLLAVLMLIAIALHAACREKANVLVSLVLFALAAFVAYGRWAIAPL